MKKIFLYLSLMIVIVFASSCNKEKKIYEGPVQVAFGDLAYSFNITSTTTSITVPIQLIADGPQGDIATTIAVNSASTSASAATVPTSATIPAGSYHVNLVIPITYASLAATGNKLVLDLSSTVKVAANYKTVTITLVKK
jgi:hypothetical protein